MFSTVDLYSGCRALAAAILFTASTGAAAQSPTLITQRALAQQGLGLAFAQNAEQTQLGMLLNVLLENKSCAPLHFTGSVKVVSSVPAGSDTRAVVHVFYDRTCKTPFIKATVTIGVNGSTYDITETATYLNQQGGQLGVLRLKVKATARSAVEVIGVGSFKPKNTPVAKLGLKCSIPLTSGDAELRCTGGLVQDFELVGRAIASLATVDATVKQVGDSLPVTFEGPPSKIFTGALGRLSVTMPTPTTLGIGGRRTLFGSAKPKGRAAEFAMFPPAPTSWTITDQAHDAKFTISVVAGSKRNFVGTIRVISTNRKLATIAVDKTGTGTITYSNGVKAAITSWLLGG